MAEQTHRTRSRLAGRVLLALFALIAVVLMGLRLLPDDRPGATPSAHARANDQTDDIAPQPVGAVVGRIVGAGGQPLGRVRVRAGSKAGYTDADGRFRIGDVPAGTTGVEARPSGYLPSRVEVDVRAGGEAQASLTLRARARSRPAPPPRPRPTVEDAGVAPPPPPQPRVSSRVTLWFKGGASQPTRGSTLRFDAPRLGSICCAPDAQLRACTARPCRGVSGPVFDPCGLDEHNTSVTWHHLGSQPGSGKAVLTCADGR